MNRAAMRRAGRLQPYPHSTIFVLAQCYLLCHTVGVKLFLHADLQPYIYLFTRSGTDNFLRCNSGSSRRPATRRLSIAITITLITLFAFPFLVLAQSSAEYGGPSVLSRGDVPSTSRNGKDISFRPYVGVNAIYETGLTSASIDSRGHLPNVDTYGVEADVGLYGYHNFRHTALALSYDGNFRHFPHNQFYDGSNHILSLGIRHQVSRRTEFSFHEIGGTYSRYYLFSSVGVFDPTLLPVPRNEVFDNQVFFLETTADFTYHPSARLSFNIGANGSLARRRSSSLYGVTTAGVHADAAYRLNRFVSFGGSYQFYHYDFTKGFGGSDIHSGEMFLSARLSQSVELSVGGGGARIESLALTVVAVDPLIAAITGQSAAIQVAYRIQYIPVVHARISKSFRQATLQFNYNRQVTPGNGLYLTSSSEEATGSFSYNGIRHWNVGLNAGYESLSALIQTLNKYQDYRGGLGITRDIGHGLHFVLRADTRYYATHYAGFSRSPRQFTAGFAWSPGDVPLSRW